MIQLMGIGAGVAAIVMGGIALAKGEIKFSAKTTLKGSQATLAGIITLVGGILLAGFFLVVFPMLTAL